VKNRRGGLFCSRGEPRRRADADKRVVGAHGDPHPRGRDIPEVYEVLEETPKPGDSPTRGLLDSLRAGRRKCGMPETSATALDGMDGHHAHKSPHLWMEVLTWGYPEEPQVCTSEG
jgi:hypothetical protein